MDILHLACQEVLIVALVVNRIVDVFIFLVLRLGGGEARVDILRDDAKLLIAAGGNLG